MKAFWPRKHFLETRDVSALALTFAMDVAKHTHTCPDHTKLSVRFQLRNCLGLCSKLDVGPLLFTITVEDANGWC